MSAEQAIAALRAGWLEGKGGRSASGGLLATLADESLLRIARWLGVIDEGGGRG